MEERKEPLQHKIVWTDGELRGYVLQGALFGALLCLQAISPPLIHGGWQISSGKIEKNAFSY